MFKGGIVEAAAPSSSPNIIFADATVKELCVANWDTNDDGELSEAEAAAVTDIGKVFRGNTTITSFNELQYFTNLTTIGDNAFDGCTALTSIAVPPSLTRVKTGAFNNCTSLSKVIVSDIAAWCGIIYDIKAPWEPLGDFPLGLALHLYSDENTEITEVVIPEGVTRIEPLAFRDAKHVTSVTIPNSVTYIGVQAFCGMERLSSVNLPQNITALDLDTYAFKDCPALTSITLPNGLRSIGWGAFEWCQGLASIVIPDGISYIPDYAFFNCSSLASVAISENVTEIRDHAFEGCTLLTSIPIPNGVTRIGHSAFRESGLESITIPSSVTSIGSYVFDDCDNLTSVTMPASVITFDENEGNAFGQSNNIEAVYISDLTAWLGTSFPNANNPLRSGAKLYLNNVEVKDLVIPEGTTAILTAAFEGCGSITSISIPNSVTSIDGWAFARCNNLTSVTIPESVTSIGGSAFKNCSSLTSINIPNGITSIEYETFSDCQALPSINIPNSVTSIGQNAFRGCQSLESVFIPESVTSIGTSAFQNCYELTSANLPNGITTINPYLFCGSPLTSIRIPNGVTSIGEWAFFSCNLSTIVIPENVESIGDNAFANCTLLTSVKVDIESPLSINSGTFYNSQANATLYVPYGSKAAYQAASYWQEFNNIIEFINGDVNSDYVTNVVDVVDIARFVVGTPAETFVEILADINRDGGVTVADAVALVNEIAGDQNFVKELYAPQVNNYDDEGCEVQLLKSGNNTLSFCLDGETDFTAFQFVMEVPEDTNVSAMRLNGNRKHGHQLIYNKVSDGTYRVVALSVSNNIFEGSEGELLGISLDGVPTDDICIRDIHFVNTAGKDFTYDKLVLGYDNETGLEGICTESLQKDGNAIYDLQGRQRTTLQPGINIVNGKKIMVK